MNSNSSTTSKSRGRNAPLPPSSDSLSATSIVEALKSMEKNPFSMNHSVPMMQGQAIVDPNALRMTGSIQRSIQLGESSRASTSATANNNNNSSNGYSDYATYGRKKQSVRRPPPTTKRTIPLDSFSRSVEFEKMLLNSAPVGDKKSTKSESDAHHNNGLQQANNENANKLNLQKTHAHASIRKIERKEEALLQETMKIVPAHMLVKHGMFDMIKGKQLDKIMNLLFKMRIQLLMQGMALWHKHAQILTTALYGASAITVHRVARGFLGRQRVKNMYKEILKRERGRNNKNAVAMMNRNFKVVMIQSSIRRYLACKVVNKERTHRNSIIRVQRFYKRWKYNNKAKKTFSAIIQMHFAAKKIQRVWRGSQGRKRAKHAIVLRHRTQRQERYESPEGVFELYFEQHGAAICIQKWYNSLHFIAESKERARAAKRRKQLTVVVIRIQKAVRFFLMNKRMMHRWHAKKLIQKYNIRPRQYNRIVKTQAAVRRFLAQRRNEVLFADIMKRREKRRRAMELGISDQHRISNRFEHLKIGNLRNIVRLERKAVMIQRWYKACRVLRYFYGMIRNRRQLIADRIRTWFRAWRHRRLLKASLRVIQPLWKRAVQRFLKRKYAQITIARKYKSYCSMKWYHGWRRNLNMMASRIQRLVRHYFSRRELKKALARTRYEKELLYSGQQLFDKTNIYNHIDEMNRRIQRTKAPIPKYELQMLFMVYCPNLTLDVAKGSKLIKECPNLATPPHLSPKELEMVFAKVKGAANGGALDYFQFLQYLFYIACVKYLSLDASTLPMANKINHNTENKKDRIKLELSLKNRGLVESFRFGRLNGRKALITKLVYQYVSNNPAYKAKEKTLERKSALNTSERTVDAALDSIQRMFKVIILRMGMYKARQIVHARKMNAKRIASSIIIQAYSRRYLGRRRGIRLAQKMYLKYIDNDSGVPFWTNSHSGTSFWTKPLLLRELDCGDGIKLPEEREQYTPPCCECTENTAACFCEQCNALYCHQHFKEMHTSGVRKFHDCITLEMCVECTFQAPTKRCLICDEFYCDTCFAFVHRRGRSRLHTCTWVTYNCYFCDDRAAHWRRIDSWNGYEEEFICTVDFWKEFDCDPKSYVDPTGRYLVYPVDYTGPSVFAWRQARDNAESERMKNEAYKKQQEELAERRRQAAVVTIQRVYRGVVVRRDIKKFISERKEFLRLRALEYPKRETWQYKLAAKHGKAKALDYDTNKEKVLRKYPTALHETVTYCIERKWGLMAELLNPVDLGDLAPESLEFKERMATYIALQKANLALHMAQKTVQSREKTHARKRERYRLARSSATAKEPKKKALQLAANKASKNVEKAKVKLNEAIDSQTFAKHKYEYFTGPKDLQNLVAKRRETGVPMPFTVDLVYNSRYAVVRYEKPSTDATVSDNLFLPKPGKWRSKIKIGNIVKIHGMHFTVVEDVEDLIDIKEQLEVELQLEKEAEAERIAKEEQEEKNRLRKERLKKSGGVYSRNESMDDEGSQSIRSGNSGRSHGSSSMADVLKKKQKEEVDENDTPFSTELTCITTEEDKKLAKRNRKEFEENNVTERIKLDRPWLFADMVFQDIHLVTVKPPLSRKLFNTSRSLHKHSLTQSYAAMNVLLLHKRSKFWAQIAKIFDDESSVGLFFVDQGKGAANKRNNNLKLCRAKVDLDYQFRLKERFLYGFKVAYNIPKSFIARKYARYKQNQEYKLLSPYRRWEKSEDKKEIQVVIESGMDESETLGFMMMDTDAPLDVARDYIQRNFRTELNDICGSAFQFFAKTKEGNEDLVPFEAEEDKWSMAYLKEIKDKKTSLTNLTFIISAQGGKLDLIDEGNASDDDIMNGDLDGSLDGF